MDYINCVRGMYMILQKIDFISHSGKLLDFKIECDALDESDWECAAYIIHKKIRFRKVFGVPRGGLKLSIPLAKYIEDDDTLPILIADDVFTTGGSMEEARKQINEKNVIGVVLFARNETPDWISAVFQMWRHYD